jgi:hypothetical protein
MDGEGSGRGLVGGATLLSLHSRESENEHPQLSMKNEIFSDHRYHLT